MYKKKFACSRSFLSLHSLLIALTIAGTWTPECSNAQGNLIDIEFVTISDPGNEPDLRYRNIPVGSVDYSYEIGKYEITAGQYTDFLNAIADTDTFGLYVPGMASGSFRAHILRSGASGSFSYSVAPAQASLPVDLVSFWDAARFANWLHNGQPTGVQGPGTTEDGAYLNIGDQIAFARQPGAKFVLPNENEWYKAAYYDPNHGGPGIGGYWEYPTGTNAIPGFDTTEITNPGNNINYNFAFSGFTEVGRFHLSESPFGTFDQGGNVTEWNETPLLNLRSLRGGSWVSESEFLRGPRNQAGNFPTIDGASFGFRVVRLAVPEPSTTLLVGLSILLTLQSRQLRAPSTTT